MYSQKANNQPLQEFNIWFQNVLKNSSSETDIPIERFTLSLTGHPVCSPELETFCMLCGPNIKYLTLQISDLETNGQGSDGANHFFTTVRMLLENVETLHVKLADRKNDQKYVTTAYIFDNIFSTGSALTTLKRLELTLTRSIDFSLLEKFPAVQELVLRAVYEGNDPGEFQNFFTHLSGLCCVNITKNRHFLNLKSLDTIGVPKDSVLSLTAAYLVRLEHLALSVTCVISDNELKECLSEYKNKLKSLKLLRCRTRGCAPFSQLPLGGSFLNLKEMELWGNVVSSLDFLLNITRAEKLRVDYYCFDCPFYSGKVSDGPADFKGDMVLNSSALKGFLVPLFPYLQEFVTDCKLSPYSWEVLAIWIPNLRVLEARIPDNNTLLDLYEAFKKLEKLRLRFGSEVDDVGIVGGPVNIPNLGLRYTRGIWKLESLCSFELEVECGKGKLTDKSAWFGFLQANSLRSLKLGFTGNLLTEEVEMVLRLHIEHVELYRSCSKIAEGEKVRRCCEWADFKRDWQID